MNKKGFTIVELLTVILLLGIIATITTPLVLNATASFKEEAHKRQVKLVEEAADRYVNDNIMTFNNNCINISFLKANGYLNSKKLKDPKTGEDMTGSVAVTKNNYKYTYSYQEIECP